MKLLTTAKATRAAIRKIMPRRIAVAYVGAQWRDYVVPKGVEEIIVSPTLGSNPYAIRDLMRALGDDKVHFLDALHAKIYVGAKAAVVGSCNLSQNGMGDGGREEVAIELTDAATLRALEKTFARYKMMAQTQYRTRNAKETALEKLTKKWHLAVARDLVGDERQVPTLTDYRVEPGKPTIHIVWYIVDDMTWNLKAVRAAIPDIDKEPDDYFSNHMSFLEEDPVKDGDWILCWHAKRNGLPRTQRGDMAEWMYVHRVIPGGKDDEQYTKVAAETAKLKKPGEPFALNAATTKAIQKVLAARTFPVLLSHKNDVWPLAPADEVVPAFLTAVQKEMRAARRTPKKKARKGLKRAG